MGWSALCSRNRFIGPSASCTGTLTIELDEQSSLAYLSGFFESAPPGAVAPVGGGLRTARLARSCRPPPGRGRNATAGRDCPRVRGTNRRTQGVACLQTHALSELDAIPGACRR